MTEIPHDPGGKTIRPLPRGVIGAAIYGGSNNCYRYLAEYHQNPLLDKPRALLVVGMNPSTAREDAFDPTIDKVWRFATARGFNRLMMMNGHAYRATDQSRLITIEDPVGPRNDEMILSAADRADMILMTYGTPKHKKLRDRGPAVARMLIDHGHKLHVLRLSVNGVPWHPLYLPGSVDPFEWSGPVQKLIAPL